MDSIIRFLEDALKEINQAEHITGNGMPCAAKGQLELARIGINGAITIARIQQRHIDALMVSGSRLRFGGEK